MRARPSAGIWPICWAWIPQEENRVTFGEITKKGVTQGMAAPRAIDMDLFNAQQARRVLDRLVGYKLSPFLWKKVRRGLSAGRVQSVAVRLIVDREKEIEAFKPEEYWNIDALLSPPSSTKKFTARLYGAGGRQEAGRDERRGRAPRSSRPWTARLIPCPPSARASGKRCPRPRLSPPPCSRRPAAGWASRQRAPCARPRTLYEGVDIAGQGTMGLITYMRTDSLRICGRGAGRGQGVHSPSTYGDGICVSGQTRTYKRKSATAAQDAHEAVRPTNPALTPDRGGKERLRATRLSSTA